MAAPGRGTALFPPPPPVPQPVRPVPASLPPLPHAAVPPPPTPANTTSRAPPPGNTGGRGLGAPQRQRQPDAARAHHREQHFDFRTTRQQPRQHSDGGPQQAWPEATLPLARPGTSSRIGSKPSNGLCRATSAMGRRRKSSSSRCQPSASFSSRPTPRTCPSSTILRCNRSCRYFPTAPRPTRWLSPEKNWYVCPGNPPHLSSSFWVLSFFFFFFPSFGWGGTQVRCWPHHSHPTCVTAAVAHVQCSGAGSAVRLSGKPWGQDWADTRDGVRRLSPAPTHPHLSCHLPATQSSVKLMYLP